MEKARLVGLLETAAAVFGYIDIIAGEPVPLPVRAADVLAMFAEDPNWYDDLEDYEAEWDEDERTLYLGEK